MTKNGKSIFDYDSEDEFDAIGNLSAVGNNDTSTDPNLYSLDLYTNIDPFTTTRTLTQTDPFSESRHISPHFELSIPFDMPGYSFSTSNYNQGNSIGSTALPGQSFSAGSYTQGNSTGMTALPGDSVADLFSKITSNINLMGGLLAQPTLDLLRQLQDKVTHILPQGNSLTPQVPTLPLPSSSTNNNQLPQANGTTQEDKVMKEFKKVQNVLNQEMEKEAYTLKKQKKDVITPIVPVSTLNLLNPLYNNIYLLEQEVLSNTDIITKAKVSDKGYPVSDQYFKFMERTRKFIYTDTVGNQNTKSFYEIWHHLAEILYLIHEPLKQKQYKLTNQQTVVIGQALYPLIEHTIKRLKSIVTPDIVNELEQELIFLELYKVVFIMLQQGGKQYPHIRHISYHGSKYIQQKDNQIHADNIVEYKNRQIFSENFVMHNILDIIYTFLTKENLNDCIVKPNLVYVNHIKSIQMQSQSAITPPQDTFMGTPSNSSNLNTQLTSHSTAPNSAAFTLPYRDAAVQPDSDPQALFDNFNIAAFSYNTPSPFNMPPQVPTLPLPSSSINNNQLLQSNGTTQEDKAIKKLKNVQNVLNSEIEKEPYTPKKQKMDSITNTVPVSTLNLLNPLYNNIYLLEQDVLSNIDIIMNVKCRRRTIKTADEYRRFVQRTGNSIYTLTAEKQNTKPFHEIWHHLAEILYLIHEPLKQKQYKLTNQQTVVIGQALYPLIEHTIKRLKSIVTPDIVKKLEQNQTFFEIYKVVFFILQQGGRQYKQTQFPLPLNIISKIDKEKYYQDVFNEIVEYKNRQIFSKELVMHNILDIIYTFLTKENLHDCIVKPNLNYANYIKSIQMQSQSAITPPQDTFMETPSNSSNLNTQLTNHSTTPNSEAFTLPSEDTTVQPDSDPHALFDNFNVAAFSYNYTPSPFNMQPQGLEVSMTPSNSLLPNTFITQPLTSSVPNSSAPPLIPWSEFATLSNLPTRQSVLNPMLATPQAELSLSHQEELRRRQGEKRKSPGSLGFN